MNARPQQPPAPTTVEDHHERVSEALDVMEHYFVIARSCNAVRDSQMLEEAARNLEKYAIHHSKAVRKLLAAMVTDRRLGEFCRGEFEESGRHD